jgi:hypothetical protein
VYGITRTGVRFVLSNSADPARAADASAWYDTYTAAITGPGMLANVFRLENPEAAGTGQDARFAAVYDIVSPDPAAAWPATESSTSYPKDLFDDPRAALIVPALRGSWASVGTVASGGRPGRLTGAYLELSDEGDDVARYEWARRVVGTGLFYAVTRFRLIEGFPEPAQWLEIYETADAAPLTAYGRAVAALAPATPDPRVKKRQSGSYRLISSHDATAA